MQGWRPVEELTRWGFAYARVMANEAHDGLRRCVRTREVGIRMIRAAHEAGVRRLAMEALPWPAGGDPGPIRAIPPGHGGYLAQPEMRRLITTALELGWSGNGHASKEAAGEWIPMGSHFIALAGTDPFVIDQTVSIDWHGQSGSWLRDLLAAMGPGLAAWGGTAGILRAQAPDPLCSRTDVDAVVVCTDNTLT
jgi:hypothetical protein